MSAETRVARLRLTAEDEVTIGRGALLVQDALRTATLPGADEARVYVVRRLDLGAFSSDASPQTIALRIEAQLAHLRATALAAGEPGSDAAPAVWFADEVAALAALAAQVARGAPRDAWYWRHVSAAAVRAATTGEAFAIVLRAAAATAAGPLAVAIVVDAIEAARPGALLGALSREDGAALLALTVPGLAVAPVEAAFATWAPVSSTWRARLVAWAPRWRGDARAVWLALLAIVHESRAIVSPARALALAGSCAAAASRPDVDSATPEPIRAPAGQAAIAIDDPGEITPAPPAPMLASASRAPAIHREPTGDRAALAATEPGARSPEREVGSREPDPRSPPAEARVFAGARTSVAGMLFLVRPLAALGLEPWLARHPWTDGAAFVPRLLAAIARDHGAPVDDPLVAALGVPPDLLDAEVEGAFVVPTSWYAIAPHLRATLRATTRGRALVAGRLPIAAWSSGRPRALAWRPARITRGAPSPRRAWAQLAWRVALARWLRRFAGLDLDAVVRRDGVIAATRTHVDVRFPLRAADARVRAAGLDVDPGWVPWLGRVVAFRYVEGEP